tara:strand:+ start:151 stop:681 length:531 start_codon:yes stop_codon:yes gene_type:complete
MAEQFRAGTSYIKTFQSADYPASQGWSGTFYLRGQSAQSVSATASGDDFVISANAGVTVLWPAGYYQWFFEVEKGGDKHILRQGTLEVLAALANISDGVDLRSVVKKTLDAIESLIQGKAASDVQQYQINGRMLTKMSISELIKWRSKYKQWYNEEQRAEKLAQGLNTGRQVKVRF